MPKPPGTKPVPTERKRMRGNPGKRSLPSPVVALEPAVGIPEPVRPLGRHGQEIWNRVWRTGARWISPDTDIELLQIVCEGIDERSILRTDVIRHGERDKRAALRQLDNQIINGLSLLGLTPTDRARLGVAEVMTRSTLARLQAERGSATA